MMHRIVSLISLVILLSLNLTHANDPQEETKLTAEVNVKTGTISDATLHRYVLAFGKVEPAPATAEHHSASSKIVSLLSGIVTHINGTIGQEIKQGQTLLSLDDGIVQAQRAKARVGLNFAQKNLARKKTLTPNVAISQKLIDDAELLTASAEADEQTASAQIKLLTIQAPITGTLTQLHVHEGETINAQMLLAELVDLSRLVLILPVPSTEAKALQLGQSVQLLGSTNKQTSAWGAISLISPQIDVLTDTVLVYVSMTKDSCPKSACLRLGETVAARITVETRAHCLVVPIRSLKKSDTDSQLALIEGNTARLHPVNTGLQEGDLIEISGTGVHAGMSIVTEGVYGLPDQSRIKVTH